VVLALGVSNNKTIETKVKRLVMLYDKTTQQPAGFITLCFIRPDATPDGLDYTHFFSLSTFFS
jgi:hypothetical protein